MGVDKLGGGFTAYYLCMDEEMDMEFEDDDEFVEYLIEMCILEEQGFDEDGEILYTYNFERMKVLMPQLYEEIIGGVNDKMMTLFESGLVTVDYDTDLTARFSATPEGLEFFTKKYHSEGGLEDE